MHEGHDALRARVPKGLGVLFKIAFEGKIQAKLGRFRRTGRLPAVGVGGVIEEAHPDAIDFPDLGRIVLLLGAESADIIHAAGIAGVHLGQEALPAAVQGVVVAHGQHIHAAVHQGVQQRHGSGKPGIAGIHVARAHDAVHIGHGVIRVADEVCHGCEHIMKIDFALRRPGRVDHRHVEDKIPQTAEGDRVLLPLCRGGNPGKEKDQQDRPGGRFAKHYCTLPSALKLPSSFWLPG